MRLLPILKHGIAWLIATVLFLAAIGKLLDNRQFADVLAQWRLFPGWSLLPLGVIMSLAELVLAIWLFAGWRLSAAALLSVLFHLGYTVATTITLLRGIRLPDCGCFGVFFAHPLNWTMAVEDLGVAGLSTALYFLARKDDVRRNRV